ncbi:KR-domain-containing protein [Aaosphaeria arxii CBS 175.79]|uniref:KR-domain-containing protein n=1 Tax=Aaosphaeria arxii CBS 175.79 TaxID=1450172 RepID=A0A6A5X7K9_9PLEO|nr:KR-domain-containing protein [Aaosphaeria arxii CBS 175.79]KAF2008774.1 KR-domain-containing protein [Aaosphaeria arxii CBS 175.79]
MQIPQLLQSLRETAEALEYGTDIGSKAVVHFHTNDIVKIAPPRATNRRFSPDGTYIFGDLTAKGVNIKAPPCDVYDEKILKDVLKEASQTMPPVKGVLQATMVLREGIISNLNAEDWHAALAPKRPGYMEPTQQPSQGLGLLRLPQLRRGCLGCLIVGVGWATETDKTNMLVREGYFGMPKNGFMNTLGYCCDLGNQVTSPQQTQLVSGLGNMKNYKPSTESEIYWAWNTICAVLRQMNAATTSEDDEGSNEVRAIELLAAAETHDKAIEVLLQALIGKLSKLFNIPAIDIDPTMPIFSIGIESLVAFEIRHWLMKELEADLAVAESMEDQTLINLANTTAQKSKCTSKA